MTEPTAAEKREINRRIAEVEGWTEIDPAPLRPSGMIGKSPGGVIASVPNYASDLNEMHRLMEGMEEGEMFAYIESLSRMIPDDLCAEEWDFCLATAPAWVRAKVYLEVKDG